LAGESADFVWKILRVLRTES